ncbi:IS3 family transposase [Paraclostridium sordellii]|uniref:IS3 family transposase n=1 Tax=Paraclostridium sordellii TaxID=1505 RepID=UPI003BAF7DC6
MNCWDNSPKESFFGHMKDEINYKNCTIIGELKISINDYMDYYNNLLKYFLFLMSLIKGLV